MIKALAAAGIAVFAAAAITILPSFAPPVAASGASPAVKTERHPAQAANAICAEQNWPRISDGCLRRSDGGRSIAPARLVTANRG